jgi:hypothetical protein
MCIVLHVNAVIFFNVHGTVHCYCILKHDQQDATLYNTLYHCQLSTCFERFFRSSAGAQIYSCSIRYLSLLFAVTASVDELGLQIRDAACNRFELLMMSGKAARNM